jgi:hypothetical protein
MTKTAQTGSVNTFKRIKNILTACSETDEVEACLALPDCAPRLCATGERDGPIWATTCSRSELL